MVAAFIVLSSVCKGSMNIIGSVVKINGLFILLHFRERKNELRNRHSFVLCSIMFESISIPDECLIFICQLLRTEIVDAAKNCCG